METALEKPARPRISRKGMGMRRGIAREEHPVSDARRRGSRQPDTWPGGGASAHRMARRAVIIDTAHKIHTLQAVVRAFSSPSAPNDDPSPSPYGTGRAITGVPPHHKDAMSFTELGLSEKVLAAVKETGYTQPTPCLLYTSPSPRDS